jgi:hypothetical protein
MAAGVTLKHKRKAGAFANGELAAGEWGLDITNSHWYFSTNGTTVQQVTAAAADQNPNLLVQAADYNLAATYGLVVPSDYEIGSGFVLDIATDAVLDIV